MGDSADVIDEILNTFSDRGSRQYGGEAVSQKEHALQAAWAAERAGSDAELVAAALLHDFGHLIYEASDDDYPAGKGIDDRHELFGAAWLERYFGPGVVRPIAMHVDAKRYLCAAQAGYFERLSPASVRSLELQGGPMTEAEAGAFRQDPQFEAALRLRHWDEEAKVAELQTPDLEHFRPYLAEARRRFLGAGS